MAEGAGFEPAVPLVGVHTISSRAPSARLGHPSLREENIGKLNAVDNLNLL